MRETDAGRYTKGQRTLHWLTVALVAVQVPVGLWMYRRGVAGVFDDLTNALYSWHKLVGSIILLVILTRLVMRARHPAPPLPDHIPETQAAAAHGLHWLIYALAVIVPLLGWAGVTAYPALGLPGGLTLPRFPFVPENQDLANRLFWWHGWAAITLVVLVVGHIGAALMHLLVKRDGVFQRMWSDRP
jgi:cytochrome b561